jgi:hypothetical protein
MRTRKVGKAIQKTPFDVCMEASRSSIIAQAKKNTKCTYNNIGRQAIPYNDREWP